MHDERDGNAVLKWVAVALPGLSAGIGWAAAAGWPPLQRVLCGVAVGLVIYALLHFLLKGLNGERQ